MRSYTNLKCLYGQWNRRKRLTRKLNASKLLMLDMLNRRLSVLSTISGAVLVGIFVNVTLIGALFWYARAELPLGAGVVGVIAILISEVNLFRALNSTQREKPLGTGSPDRLTTLV